MNNHSTRHIPMQVIKLTPEQEEIFKVVTKDMYPPVVERLRWVTPGFFHRDIRHPVSSVVTVIKCNDVVEGVVVDATVDQVNAMMYGLKLRWVVRSGFGYEEEAIRRANHTYWRAEDFSPLTIQEFYS